jgi:ATP-dependent Zn protease
MGEFRNLHACSSCINKSEMEDTQLDQSFFSIILGWFPIIVLIIVWIVFMRKHRGTQAASIDYMKKQVEHTERMALAMERVAEAIEKRMQS